MGLVVLWLLLALTSCTVAGLIAGNIARKRGASYGGYFALGFFFGLIGVVAAAFAGNRQPQVVHHHYYAADGRETFSGRALNSAPSLSARPALQADRPVSFNDRTCPDVSCSAHGRPTLNNECKMCETPTVPMRRVAGLAATGHRGPAPTRACATDGCSQNGEPTSNLVCQACRHDTVSGAVPRRPSLVLPPAPKPGVQTNRACRTEGCVRQGELTSDLLCRGCRRDTAVAAVPA